MVEAANGGAQWEEIKCWEEAGSLDDRIPVSIPSIAISHVAFPSLLSLSLLPGHHEGRLTNYFLT